MQPHMVRLLPHLNSNGQVQRLRISVSLVPGLVDRVRYALPEELPAPAGLELRAMGRPRITLSRPRQLQEHRFLTGG